MIKDGIMIFIQCRSRSHRSVVVLQPLGDDYNPPTT